MDKEDFLVFQDKKIWYRLTVPDEEKLHQAILFMHGSHFSTSFSHLINLLKKDFVCLSFSHLGCGKSEGRFEDYSLHSRLEQSVFVLNKLKSLKNILNINVVGVSMGGHVAARLSEKTNIKSLILRAPASYARQYEDVKMVPYPSWLPWDKKNKNWPWKPSCALDSIKKFTGDLLIVRCELDEIIPDKIIDEYYKKAVTAKSRKIKTIKGARHYMSNQPEFLDMFADIIKNQLNAN